MTACLLDALCHCLSFPTQARLSEVEKELAAEREARRKLEKEMDQLRESASRGGA